MNFEFIRSHRTKEGRRIMAGLKMKSGNFGKSTSPRRRLLSGFLLLFVSVAVVTFCGLPAAIAEQGEEQQDVSKEEIEKYQEIQKAAKKAKVEEAVEEDKTGTDPRAFTDKWMPYYRYTELENELIQQDVTMFGTVRFGARMGMFFELPVAQYRDFSDVPGFPPDADSDAIGLGDADIKFLMRPGPLEFSYGKEGKMSASVLLGTDFLLPTATDDALGGNAFVFAPIAALVFDMPFHGFIAMLNLYYFDVYKEASAPETSRFVGKWFYMQPLTPPGAWWGGFFLLPEFQPIYDFETDDFSAWFGLELGKMVAPGRILYVKPGWGIDNSEPTDRKLTIEAGVRWFF
jgi:hypothetical protein